MHFQFIIAYKIQNQKLNFYRGRIWNKGNLKKQIKQIKKNKNKNNSNIHIIQHNNKKESSQASQLSIPLETIPLKGKSFSRETDKLETKNINIDTEQ